MGGLKEWFKQDWVDIGSKKKGGGFNKCGRKSASGSKRKYPKCVPAAKAARMTDSQRRSAVARKRSKPQGVGGKPTNVRTFAKRKNIRNFTPGAKERDLLKPKTAKPIEPRGTIKRRQNKMGGGMTMMPRATYGKGGGVCKKGMGRAYGKNS